MNWLDRASVGTRLSLGFGCVLVLLAAAALSGWHGLRSLRTTALSSLETEVQVAQQAAHLRILILTARRFEKDSFINMETPEKFASYRKKWRENHEVLVKSVEALRHMKLSEADARSVDTLASALPGYAKGFGETVEQIDKGLLGTADDANRSFEKYKHSVTAMDQASAEINDRALAKIAQAEQAIADGYSGAASLLGLMTLACFAAGAVMSGLISQSLKRQLGGEPADLVEAVNAIADGNLGVPIKAREGGGHSVVGATQRMKDSLARIVAQVRNGSDSIATGSTQIAIGNADLSQRTEEQASNLQQTAASMEQLSSTVKANADSAHQATVIAGRACDAAVQGGQTVQAAVSTMNDIAASSKKISDIIGVIDGIAFQTNILALNAAVEAARAGEQGKGFAVVASEVRNLASRSSNAAREIKSLIGESVSRVEAGVRQVGDAGTAIQDIVAQVQRVSQLIDEISSATAEQSNGIGQVGASVTQLDHATQQNAALVEQSAAAAENLQNQAQKLASLVSVFKL